MKHFILILSGLLWLAACSPFSGSDRTRPALAFQPSRNLTPLVPSCLASSEDLGVISTTAVIGKQEVRSFVVAGEPLAASQDLFSNQSSAITDTLTPIITGSATLLEEIQNLAAQRRSDFVPAAPGWLHLITRSTQSKVDPISAWDFSNGLFQQEEWLSLDDQGLVRTDIRRVLNDQGQAGEYNLLSGGAWSNLTLAAKSQASIDLPYDPNYGIYELIAQLVSQGQVLNKATLYKECWYQGEKYTISDGKTIHEVLFRPDYHALRWIKTWQVSSGAITLVDSMEIALEERLPRPPDDILALVAQAEP